jgi:AraC-like DNA-binding protein
VEYEKPQGYVLLFSAQFLVENNIPGFLIEDLNLFNEEGNSPPLALTGEEYLKLSGFCEEMIRLYNSGLKFKEQAISAFLQLFLIHANSFCTLVMANPQNQEAGNSILRDFKKLIRENYSKWHLTSEYAKLLYVTPDHLNRVVNSLTGKTAKDLIKAQIIIAAKRMIYFSGLTTKEIAYQLGFSSPANFSAFFRNYTGYSPSEFNKLR